MFQLSVVDHIRLSFASVAGAYEGHAEAAARLSAWNWYGRLAVLSTLAGAWVATLLAIQGGRPFAIAALAAASLAFVTCALWVGLDLEPRIHGHRTSAAKLWLLCEDYRALLAEVQDQLVDARAVTERRDALARDVRAVFEHASPDDRQTYEIARKALGGVKRAGFSDEDIDRLLPPSLQRPKAVEAPLPQGS